MFTNYVKVYVPSTVSVNQKAWGVEIKEVRETVCRRFAGLFGGFTSQTATGGWISPTAGLVVEEITLVYAFCDGATLQKRLPEVVRVAQWVCDRLGQECVSLEVNGTLHFINALTPEGAINELLKLAA